VPDVGQLEVRGVSARGTKVSRASDGQHRRRRAWLGGMSILSSHIRAFERSGRVAPSIRPSFNSALQIVGAYTLDIDPTGGEQLTAGQALVLMKLQRALTISGALFEKFVASGDPAILEGASTWLREEGWALAQLGLERVPRDVTEPLSEERLRAAAAAAGYDFTPSGESVEPSGGPSAPERTLSGSVVTS
jgi:hypothetical protein